jgi:hypothetical protein
MVAAVDCAHALHRGSPDLATKKWRCRAPAWPRKKMELRGFEPTTLLFKDRWATTELRFVSWLMFLIYVIYTICWATSNWCFWYMSFTLYVVPRQNNIKMMRQWGFKPWPPRTWSIVSPLHQHIVGAFSHLLNINTRTWIRCGCLDQWGCAPSLI